MTRDHTDLDAALSRMTSRRAPAGFAARLSDRYAHAIAVRRRRAALLLSAFSGAGLAVIGLSLLAALHGSTGSLHSWVNASVAGFSTLTSVLAHALVHPLVHAFPAFALAVVVLAAVTAGCCVALAVIIRGMPVLTRAR
jgi:hypothetical protein